MTEHRDANELPIGTLVHLHGTIGVYIVTASRPSRHGTLYRFVETDFGNSMPRHREGVRRIVAMPAGDA